MNYKDQLIQILEAGNLTQEQLAQELGVAFSTLNAWKRGRANPRKGALEKINRLYLSILGSESVDDRILSETVLQATNLKLTAEDIIENKYALDQLTLHLTYHTNTIEGSTMTLADVEEVLFDHKLLSNRTAVEQTEARNHQAALNWILDSIAKDPVFVINEEFIKGIHLRLMNGIISDAGTYRVHSVRIQGSRTTVSNYLKIGDLMSLMVDTIEQDNKDIIYKIAKIHADFEKIHPFSDGNGRTGRLIMLTMALLAKLTPPIILKERKQAYYKYLEFAQMDDNIVPLKMFIAESIITTHDLLSR